jgi:co-chaperonin GroES (HSP10)|tara:strand:+ start:548 stop:796 length:249 start_codon:yes stop_codon:yes gene_type:complete
MKVLGDRVLVEVVKAKDKKNGLIIIDSAQKKETGKVLIVGVKTKTIQVGDTIQYYPQAGTPMTFQEKECLFLSEEQEVIAIL